MHRGNERSPEAAYAGWQAFARTVAEYIPTLRYLLVAREDEFRYYNEDTVPVLWRCYRLVRTASAPEAVVIPTREGERVREYCTCAARAGDVAAFDEFDGET